ncbi:hypothetical protein PH214_16185 (plasmid) [Nitratidesulfovibrio vulgaris]|jgi:predicted transcriptional regulator|nr:hypothetical protein [Nitratidesulfovibrio vulgaris]WCB48086.1 hypothetical protein PH214_16185 [Nitratidesulfovibrio vulgaris]
MNDHKKTTLRIDEGLQIRIFETLRETPSERLHTIAYEAGVSFWTVSKIAAGKQKSTSFETAFRLALVLFPDLKVRPRRRSKAESEASLEKRLMSARAALELIADGDMDAEAMVRCARAACERSAG